MKTLLLFFILFGFIVTKNAFPKEQPNVILILTDDLGFSDVSCYRKNYESLYDEPSTSQTPNIDKLADEGMRFTDFYSGAAVCSPSRAALLTGRNCTRVGIYNWIPENQPMHFRAEEITIAEILKKAGYETGHFGKWHLTSKGMGQPLPTDQGFDYAFYTYNNANPSHKNPDNFYRNGKSVGELKGYSCQLVIDEAIDWLAKIDKNEHPFYVNLWFNEPHQKVAAPPEFSKNHSYRNQYYGCIENMDNAIGRIMNYLKDNNLEENTIVIFTSDNGSQVASSDNPLRGEKAFNYEGGIRVPFIVKWPGHIEEGRTSGVAGSFTDVLPTLTAITKTKLPENHVIDGIDLSEVLLQNQAVERNEPIFFFRYFHEPVTMLRKGDWVLLGYYDEPLPYKMDYDVREQAKLKPLPGKPRWSNWGFQESHMEYLKTAVPQHFELYNIRDDIFQKDDVLKSHPEKAIKMIKETLDLRKEMIDEGGDWYN
jgi:arylsulfatase A